MRAAASVRHVIAEQPYVQLLRSHRGWRLLAVLAAMGVVIIAALGGFRTATPATTGPAHSPGTPLQLGAYTITALAAAVGPRMPGQAAIVDGGKLVLAVKIRVLNNSDSGSYMGPNLKSSLMLLGESPRELAPDDLVWADTGSRDLVLPPHLPVELIALWKLPSGGHVPPHVEIGAYKVIQGYSRISLAPEWARGARGGYWRLPLEAP